MQQISIWEAESFYTKQHIIVVGAGFTGMWVALFLKQKYPNKRISIVDRGAIPEGASIRNAGLACFGSLTEILSDIKAIGIDKTSELLRWRFEGLRTIRQYFNDSAFDYYNYGGYELLNTDQPLDQLSIINKLLYNITSSSDTFKLKNEFIEPFGFAHVKHLIENSFEGGLHPGKLLALLQQKLMALDVNILFGTEIKSYEDVNNELELLTTDGRSLKADQVVFCTNAFSKSLLPHLPIVPARGQVLVTAPIPELKIKGVFHYDEGYYYFRNVNGCILLGGARNTSFETEYTLESITTLPIQQALENLLTTVILPNQTPSIAYRWAGIMAMGTEKTPIIKQLTDRTFCAVRLSGMGVALAPTIGKILSDMI